MQINILEAKNRLSELIRLVEEGAEVIIAKRGKPVARLVSVTLETARDAPRPGDPKAIVAWLANHRLSASRRRSSEEIEADILDARNSWG